MRMCSSGDHQPKSSPASTVAPGDEALGVEVSGVEASGVDGKAAAGSASQRRYTVGVAGASGYAGGEFLRLALAHPQLDIGQLTAHSQVGTRLGQVHPHLHSVARRTFVPTDVQHLAGHDVVVLALPHGQSGALAAQLPPDTLVLDLGADHRLKDPQAWKAFYGSEHSGCWDYGLPELIIPGHLQPAQRSRGARGPAQASVALPYLARQRNNLAQAKRIAVPGCNVTAVTLGLQPGIAHGLIDSQDLVAVLANGYSGAGKSLHTHLLAAEAMGSATPYAVGGSHRHIPEIQQNLQQASAHLPGRPPVTISFTPTLVPMSRGILATATARLSPALLAQLTDQAGGPAQVLSQLREVWQAAYEAEPFVHLLPQGQWPSTAMTLGANTALIQIAVDAAAGRLVTVTAIDNLVKGTAGGAIQSLNIALGLDEASGLSTTGLAP